jgi:hypothetical protein
MQNVGGDIDVVANVELLVVFRLGPEYMSTASPDSMYMAVSWNSCT